MLFCTLFFFVTSASGAALPSDGPLALSALGTRSSASGLQSSTSEVVRLPGFASLPKNQTTQNHGSEGEGGVLSPASVTFDGRCHTVTLSGGGRVGQATIEGRCVDGNGIWWDTSLNLNKCIANRAGRLVYHEEWVWSML